MAPAPRGGAAPTTQSPLSICFQLAHNQFMDAVDHPLDWWAVGGYRLVMHELKCSKTIARHKVHAKIDDYFRRTGDPIWKPVGNRGFIRLRRAIMAGQALDNDLV